MKEEVIKCYCGHTTTCDCGPKEELELTEKQREKRQKKIEVKKSEEKLLTVHKLDSQMAR